jgi:nucleoside-diphosphate-sugar epimerase
MTTAVIGATGRVGSQIVRGVLARGDPVAALVRDPGKARRAFGEPGGLHIRPTRPSWQIPLPQAHHRRPWRAGGRRAPGPYGCRRSWPSRCPCRPE